MNHNQDTAGIIKLGKRSGKKSIDSAGSLAAHELDVLQREVTTVSRKLTNSGLSTIFMLPEEQYTDAAATYRELIRFDSKDHKRRRIVCSVNGVATSDRFIRKALAKAMSGLLTDAEKDHYCKSRHTSHASEPNGLNQYY